MFSGRAIVLPKVEIAERACFFLVDDVPLGEMFGDDMVVMTGGFRE